MTDKVKMTIDEHGTKIWCLDGILHREDGPAIEGVNGTRVWAVDGKCHREDGPAMVLSDGVRYWFIDGDELTEDEFNARSKNND